MMMSKLSAGEYNRLFTRLTRTLTTGIYGDKSYVWKANGDYYWGKIEQTGSIEIEEQNRTTTHTTANIRLRGWINPDLTSTTTPTKNTISTLDKLTDQQWNETYYITSIARGMDETLISGYKL